MRELGRSFSSNGQGTLAVLTAINLADEYFDIESGEWKSWREENEKLKEETQHYLKPGRKPRRISVSYKEAAAKAAEEEKKAEEDRYSELEKRCSEFESSFFDLQMENLQLKRETGGI